MNNKTCATISIICLSLTALLFLALAACSAPFKIEEKDDGIPEAEEILTFAVRAVLGHYTVYKIESTKEGVTFYVLTLPGDGVQGFAAVPLQKDGAN